MHLDPEGIYSEQLPNFTKHGGGEERNLNYESKRHQKIGPVVPPGSLGEGERGAGKKLYLGEGETNATPSTEGANREGGGGEKDWLSR